MHVDHDAPAVVAEAHNQRDLRAGTQPRGSKADAEKSPDGGVSQVAKTMSRPAAALSPVSLGATIASQADTEPQPSATTEPSPSVTTAAHGKSAETPAALARAMIESDPTLADRPFGHIVSAIARGIEVTPSGGGTEGEDPGDGAPLAGETSDPTAVAPVPTEDDSEAPVVPVDGTATEGTPAGAEAQTGLVPDLGVSTTETLAEQLLDLLDPDDEAVT